MLGRRVVKHDEGKTGPVYEVEGMRADGSKLDLKNMVNDQRIHDVPVDEVRFLEVNECDWCAGTMYHEGNTVDYPENEGLDLAVCNLCKLAIEDWNDEELLYERANSKTETGDV